MEKVVGKRREICSIEFQEMTLFKYDSILVHRRLFIIEKINVRSIKKKKSNIFLKLYFKTNQTTSYKATRLTTKNLLEIKVLVEIMFGTPQSEQVFSGFIISNQENSKWNGDQPFDTIHWVSAESIV